MRACPVRRRRRTHTAGRGRLRRRRRRPESIEHFRFKDSFSGRSLLSRSLRLYVLARPTDRPNRIYCDGNKTYYGGGGGRETAERGNSSQPWARAASRRCRLSR